MRKKPPRQAWPDTPPKEGNGPRPYSSVKHPSFLLIALCLLLSACSQQQSLKLEADVVDTAVSVMQERIASYTQWDLQMRIALRHDKLSWRGIMQWSQRENGFAMTFNDMLGRRLLFIESQPDGSVSAVDSKGRQTRASDPSALIKSMLGTEVPIESLRYWLLGAPAPGESYFGIEFDAQGRLQLYKQSEWTISYTDYRDNDCLDWSPGNLTLNREQTQLWLRIRSWQTPPSIVKTSAC